MGEKEEQVPISEANSIRVSKEVFRSFIPALTNLLAYLHIKSQLSVWVQMLQ